jgi:hypothetical protein
MRQDDSDVLHFRADADDGVVELHHPEYDEGVETQDKDEWGKGKQRL